MFFFFPFAADAQAAPAPQRSVRDTVLLPLLPVSRNSHAWESPAEPRFGTAMQDIANAGLEILRRTLTSITTLFTALGSRANALFSLLAAALAFERAARETASLFRGGWPPFGMQSQRPAYGAGWPDYSQAFAPFFPFASQGFPMNPWGQNPWSGFNEAVHMWTKMWVPSPAPRQPRPYGAREPAPFTTNFSVPGFSWGFTIG